MGFYRDFHKKNINLEPLGVNRSSARTRSFCASRDISVIGVAGDSGVQYCFARNFDEAVFQIDPKAGRGEYAHVIARDFKDFLRLLLACGNSSALNEAWRVERGEFEKLRSLPDSGTLEAFAGLNVTPMEDPFGYINMLQDEINLKELGFPAAYSLSDEDDGFSTSWQVYFGRGFYEAGGRSQPCRENSFGTGFALGGEEWKVLSAYVSVTGLVIDVLEPAGEPRGYQVEVFANTQNLRHKNDFAARLVGDMSDYRARSAAEHYSLPIDGGQTVRRWNFIWQRRRRPELGSLKMRFRLTDTGECAEVILK